MTNSKPAPTAARRIPRILVAGLLVVIAAIAAALGHQSPASSPPTASSSPTAAAPIDVPRGAHRGALGEAVPSTVWPAQGQAAVQIGQAQIQAGPNQHAAAIASVAKVMTASPAATRSRRVSRPPTPWSTASPVIGLRQI
jgi:hypothetical protein